MIEVLNLTKSYRTENGRHYVFKDISVTFPAGANIGILGPNGGGKSTLLRLLGGIDYPDSGRIVSPYSFSWPLGLKGGFVGHLSGRENCRMVCNLYGLPPEIVRSKLEDIKQLSDLDKFFEEPVNTYSSGMGGRLGFALSMAFDFDYFLIDEITSVGDARFKKIAKDALLQKARRSRVVMVSHNIADVKTFCDVGVVVRDGGIQVFTDLDAAIRAYLRPPSAVSSPGAAASAPAAPRPAAHHIPPEVEVRLAGEAQSLTEQIRFTLAELEPKLEAPSLRIKGEADAVWFRLGRTYEMLHQADRARHAYRQALAVNPLAAQAKLRLRDLEAGQREGAGGRLAQIETLLDAGLIAEGLQRCRDALAATPDAHRLHHLLARLLARQGEGDAAIAAQLRARSLAPGNSAIAAALTDYMAANGDPAALDLASRRAEAFKAPPPRWPTDPDTLAKILERLTAANRATRA